MSLSKTYHKDGNATVVIVLDGVAHSMTISEWSKMLATALVIEEE